MFVGSQKPGGVLWFFGLPGLTSRYAVKRRDGTWDKRETREAKDICVSFFGISGIFRPLDTTDQFLCPEAVLQSDGWSPLPEPEVQAAASL